MDSQPDGIMEMDSQPAEPDIQAATVTEMDPRFRVLFSLIVTSVSQFVASLH